MATIYDVARLANVSAKTVSRVLNEDGPVGPRTRQAVQEAIAQLGYVPSNAARMMRSNRSGLVGLITGAITAAQEPTHPAGLPDLLIVQGIQRVMADQDMTLMVADTGGRADRIPRLVRTFLEHRAEGLIYVADYHQRVRLPPVAGSTPLVLANCFDDAGTPAVLPDDRRGQHDLVARIAAAGHRRIAYLTLREDMVATSLRSLGYRDALAEAGLPFDPRLVQVAYLSDGEEDSRILVEAIDRLLELPDPPTVLCCGNDAMAMRVYGILRSRGVRVPEDMSVAGYDNHRIIAETLYPPLTTVELPYRDMGQRAAERLLACISGQGRDEPTPTLVSGPVLWRASVTDRPAANPRHISFNGRSEP
ncbi:LacI family DNA-binding transcriptional regulator [Rubellimicrobium mesophilum]|nr:LacI family DNA-binding transcriptional regulator [Rubellimicrobium mesophilum]